MIPYDFSTSPYPSSSAFISLLPSNQRAPFRPSLLHISYILLFPALWLTSSRSGPFLWRTLYEGYFSVEAKAKLVSLRGFCPSEESVRPQTWGFLFILITLIDFICMPVRGQLAWVLLWVNFPGAVVKHHPEGPEFSWPGRGRQGSWVASQWSHFELQAWSRGTSEWLESLLSKFPSSDIFLLRKPDLLRSTPNQGGSIQSQRPEKQSWISRMLYPAMSYIISKSSGHASILLTLSKAPPPRDVWFFHFLFFSYLLFVIYFYSCEIPS